MVAGLQQRVLYRIYTCFPLSCPDRDNHYGDKDNIIMSYLQIVNVMCRCLTVA